MNNKKSGLIDSDKLLVTIALWLALVPLFASSLTLPMLPRNIRNGMVSFNIDEDSKYGNLFIVFASVVPVLIVIVAASLKKHNRMQRNFLSMIIFCMMISMSLSGLAIFGISRQFRATPVEKPLCVSSTAAVVISLVLSLTCSLTPRIYHTNRFSTRSSELSPFTLKLCNDLDRYWNIGAYGYMIVGAVASFIPSSLAFIPVASFLVGHIVMHIVLVKIKLREPVPSVEPQNSVVDSDEQMEK